MSVITIADIHKRIDGLRSEQSKFLEHANITRPQDVKRFIETTNVPFGTYLDLYESLIESGISVSDIKKLGMYLTEEALPKTRDAKQTQTLIKRRLGSLKRKISSKIQDTTKKKPAVVKQIKQKQETVTEAYENMLNSLTTIIHCDRILENYNKISKRFNLELLFNENTRVNGVQDTVLELCHRIDTYQMPDYVKFNTIIETAWYGFESNSIEYSKSDILEVAANYFAFKQGALNECKPVLEATMLFDKDDIGKVDILTEEEPEENSGEDPYIEVKEGHIIEYCTGKPNDFSGIIKEAETQTDFEKIFKKFKQEEFSKDDKPQNKLKQLVSKLYSRSVTGVIEDTPKLLTWLRSFFILATGSIPIIGPVIMVVGFIADRFISMHMERKEVEQMIRCFKNEIKTSKVKLSTLTNYEEKDRMNKYIKALEDAEKKIEDYHDNMLTSDELSAKYDNMFEDDDETPIDTSSMTDEELEKFMNDDDDSFDFDDFLEMASLINSITESVDQFVKNNSYMVVEDNNMYQLVQNLDTDDLTSIATIASLYPEELYKTEIYEGFKDNIRDIRSDKIHISSVVEKAIRIAELQTGMSIMESTKPIEAPDTVYEARFYLDNLTEAYGALSLMISASHDKNDPIMEASISNTLKMASMKLRNALQKLSDKEKAVSKNVDVGLNNLTKSVERALTNDNREAIIKGSILPSASKLIKLGIANAGLIAIGQPVLAVIGTLGYLGTSAKFKAKERQMLIDEIEIELKMCQKYIDIAESKNDMKALKQLLMTQRDLERQHQRIKYKMKVDMGQKYYDAKHVGD